MGTLFQSRKKIISLNSPCTKSLFASQGRLELAEFEVGAVLKMKDSGIAKDSFQYKSFLEVGVFWKALNRFFLVAAFFLISIGIYGQDGLLLRGENWQKFDVDNATADFYVAKDGNDSWSGTLATPNANKTDGPFATIDKAQTAVRKLKAEVYKPKQDPVETRWIGSPHKLGKGKDIVVFIRDGYYSLKKPLVFYPEDGGERVETNLPTGAFEYHKLRDHM